jgi:hypothetical protein
MGGLPLSLRAVAGTECAGVWSTSKDCRMMMVACSRIQSLRVWSACMFVSAHASLSLPIPIPGVVNAIFKSFRAIYLSIYTVTYANAGILSLCGTEKIQSQDRCLFYHHRSARMYCTTEEAGWLQALRCAALFVSSSSQLPPTRAARGGPCTHTHTADLVRRAGSRPGNTGAAFAAVFTCDGQLLSIQQKKRLVPGRAPARPRSKLELARGAESDTATPGEAGSAVQPGRPPTCMRDPLRGRVVVLVLVGRVALHRRACRRPPQFLSMQVLPRHAARYKTDRAAPRRVAVSSRRLV